MSPIITKIAINSKWPKEAKRLINKCSQNLIAMSTSNLALALLHLFSLSLR